MTSSVLRRLTTAGCVALVSLTAACGDQVSQRPGAQPTSAAEPSITQHPSTTAPSTGGLGQASGQAGPCAAGTSVETNRAMAAYSKIIPALLRHIDRHEPIRTIYVVDRFTPDEDWDDESPPPPEPADIAPFPADMRTCFESLQLDGLSPITLVSDYDDPDIKLEPAGSGGLDPNGDASMADGSVVLELSRIPGERRTVDVAISAYFGFDDMEGATYRANESDNGWNILIGATWIT